MKNTAVKYTKVAPAVKLAKRLGKLSGNLDRAQNGVVEGWARDEELSGAISLDLYIDRVKVKTFTADLYREDLRQAGIGEGSHAFKIDIPKKYCDGFTHTVEIRTTDTGQTLPGGPLITTTERYVVGEIKGFLDTVGEREIVGWVVDSQSADDSLDVELLVNGVVVAVVRADRYRADLQEAGLGSGKNGFVFATPLHLLDDTPYEISVRVAGTDFVLPGSRTFRALIKRPYKTFKQYLSWSLSYHEMHEPFHENDKCIIAEMLWLIKHYQNKFAATLTKPLVTIIMPTYNRASIIRDSINSILGQSYSNWELIIIDDCSVDATENIVSSYGDPRIKYAAMQENSGPSAARAMAMTMASGEYFAYLDSDNQWHEDYLKIMVNLLINDPSKKSAYCAQLLRVFTPYSAPKLSVRFAPFSRAMIENVNYVDLNCFIHHRELYDRFGGFRTDIRMLEDWDLLLRYTSVADPLSVPCILSYYYHGKSDSQVTFTGNFSSTLAAIKEEHQGLAIDIDLSDFVARDVNQLRFDNNLYALDEPTRLYETARFVSIIIPSFEAAPFLELCIESIMRFSPENMFEIVVVDNGSVGDVLRVLEKYENNPSIKIVKNAQNFGFTKAVNQGIELCEPGSDIILLNNDAMVTAGWLEAFWEARDAVPGVAAIVPRQTLLAATETVEAHVPKGNPLLEVDVNLSAHHDNVVDPWLDTDKGLMELSFAAFFCVYIPREIYDRVGPLDDRNGRHYRSDVTYCDALRMLTGGKIIYTPHSKLYHFHQRATAHLKKTSPQFYDEMFSKNAWLVDDPFRSIFGHA